MTDIDHNDDSTSTRRLVRKYAMEMLAQGKPPVGNAIKKRIGHGSLDTIYSELRAWSLDMYALSKQANPQIQGIPDSLQEAAQLFWRQAQSSASEIYEPTIAALHRDIEVLGDGRRHLLQEFDKQRMAMEQAAESHAKELAAVRAALDTTSKALEAKDTALAESCFLVGQLKEGIKGKEHQLDSLRSELDKQREHQLIALREAEERYVALENQLMQRMDDERMQHRRAIESVEKKAQTDVQSIKGELARGEQVLAECNARITDLQARHESDLVLISQQALHVTHKDDELAKCQAQILDRDATIKDLRAHVSTLMKRHHGKAGRPHE